jgi:hypothetical protein
VDSWTEGPASGVRWLWLQRAASFPELGATGLKGEYGRVLSLGMASLEEWDGFGCDVLALGWSGAWGLYFLQLYGKYKQQRLRGLGLMNNATNLPVNGQSLLLLIALELYELLEEC